MGYDRRLWRARWRLPRALGAAVLTAGVLAVGLPAGTALAATAVPAAAQNSLGINTSVKALGHTWNFNVSNGSGLIIAGLGTTVAGVSEEHSWVSSLAFIPTALKELQVTSTGHATWKTGSALSPVLSVNVSFAPTKVTKAACASGSETVYTGKVTGTVALATGLRGVKVSVRFTGQSVGALTVDRNCFAKPGKNFCAGSSWLLGSTSTDVIGALLFGTKTSWETDFGQDGLKTASKWLIRSVGVLANGSAPKLNTTAKTVSVSEPATGGITGAAVITYSTTFPSPVMTCFIGSKKYKETATLYIGSAVKITKPFQAHSLLAGTLKLSAAKSGSYSSDKLTAA